MSLNGPEVLPFALATMSPKRGRGLLHGSLVKLTDPFARLHTPASPVQLMPNRGSRPEQVKASPKTGSSVSSSTTGSVSKESIWRSSAITAYPATSASQAKR